MPSNRGLASQLSASPTSDSNELMAGFSATSESDDLMAGSCRSYDAALLATSKSRSCVMRGTRPGRMHPCTGRSAASPIPVRPCATAGRAKGPMPTSPRQAKARTGTSGQGCAVAAAPRASGHPAAPISRRLPAQSERTVVGSTLPCQSRVAAAPTADGASCLAGPRSNRARSGTKHSPAPGDRPPPAPRDRTPASCRTADPLCALCRSSLRPPRRVQIEQSVALAPGCEEPRERRLGNVPVGSSLAGCRTIGQGLADARAMRRMIGARNGRATSLGLPVGRPAAGVELCQDRIFCLLALELFCGDDFRVAQVRQLRQLVRNSR
jgi:hypothetical protein